MTSIISEKPRRTIIVNFNFSPNILGVIESKKMRWVGRVARLEEGRGVYKDLMGKTVGKRTLGRPRRRWENNI